MSPQHDLVVVGSGIVGVATAAAAAERGARVLVVDKEDGPAREGSGRAQGSLRVQGRHPAELPLAVEAMRLWQRAAADDPEHDAELVTGGNLYLATSSDETPMLRSLVDQARAAGLDEVAFLEADDVRALVPAATGPVLGGMWSPYDAQVQPALATELFVRRARRAGVGFSFGTTATELLAAGGRITGLRTSRGTLRPREIVVAAGAWSSHLLASAGVALPVMPVILS
ncbi:MAG TPA: FAD-dependent oxidoreductase, partial [Candidatus Nanopelagicales bacterium]|nr:FAD-dependent oxidoreductase [Candidatus Nanopelagicales bacterium]